MDYIPKNKLLEFKPDTLLTIRKMYDLDKPGQIDEAIDLLEDWVKKQGHFIKKDYSREYLERTIILHKGSVERAKSCIEQLCTFKTLLPNYFNKYDAKKDFGYLKGSYCNILLPKLTNDNNRVLFLKYLNNDYTTKMISDTYKLGSLLAEYFSVNDYCVGAVAVLDYRDVNISNYVANINLTVLKQAFVIIRKGYSHRVQGIHFLTSSKTIDMLVKIFKKFMGGKLANRIYVHTELESLYEHVPKEILPVELNGHEKSIHVLFDEWLDVLSTNENVEYIKDIFTNAVIDKSYKKLAEFNEIHTGLDGTFRTLNVD